jgi:hypothetical protein
MPELRDARVRRQLQCLADPARAVIVASYVSAPRLTNLRQRGIRLTRRVEQQLHLAIANVGEEPTRRCRSPRTRIPPEEIHMTDGPKALSDLLEESQDMQADAVRATMQPLDEVTERGSSSIDDGDSAENQRFAAEHRRGLNTSLATAGILSAAGGGLLVGMLASPAFASSSPDVQMLQTAASIEVLAVNTYTTALTLPYIGGSAANPVVSKFASVTKDQHSQHLAAFNAALTKMGAKTQNKPDPAFVPVVNKAVAGLSGASAAQGSAGVVSLALELENIAAETYVNDVPNLKSNSNKALMASIMGIEAQHAAVLRAVQALLTANAPQLITLSPTNVASLPAAAGSVGFPNAFYPTTSAAPASQGAVK